MPENVLFRNTVGGYNKKDVNDYILKKNNEYISDIQQKQRELETAKAEYETRLAEITNTALSDKQALQQQIEAIKNEFNESKTKSAIECINSLVLPAVDTTALLYSRSTSAQGFAEKLYSISNKVFEDISLITAQSEKIEKLNKLADALNAIMSDKTFKTEDGKDNISNSCVVGDNIPALKVTADQIVTEIKVIGELVAQLKLQITSIKEACDDYNQNQEK